MTADGDKLIRQLSLVAYLMAERRPVTSRDAKGAVEGYQEMTDEAFARRFYSDRAELAQLGVPIESNRDDFTGEELYTLESEQYFLPPVLFTDAELAALQMSFYLLEGQFAYSEPLRLALQNLALGRPNPIEPAERSTVALNLTSSGYSGQIAQRLGRLESAISRQRTIIFGYRAMSTGEEATRTLDPYALYYRDSQWYVVGRDRDRDDLRVFRISRFFGDIRYATRREHDFKRPDDFDVSAFRDRADWQHGEIVGEAVFDVFPSAAWLVDRSWGRYGSFTTLPDRTGELVMPYASAELLARWAIAMDGQAVPRGSGEVTERIRSALGAAEDAHRGDPPPLAGPRSLIARPAADPTPTPSAPVAPERFAVLQALLAELLAACGSEDTGELSLADLGPRYGLDRDELVERINLLNVVNFNGGCYAVYVEIDGDRLRVQKEIYGDEFRRPARLSPLEGKAILMALELAGMQVAASAGTTLASIREKVEAAFTGDEVHDGQPGASAAAARDLEDVLTRLNRAVVERTLVRIVYLGRSDSELTQREVEPYLIRGVGSDWYVECWDRTAGGERTFRIDRIREVETLAERFEPRTGLAIVDRGRAPGGGAASARVLFAPEIAPREIERLPNASLLADGTALVDVPYGSERWATTEVLKYGGEAVVIDPPHLRARVVERARELADALVPTAARR